MNLNEIGRIVVTALERKNCVHIYRHVMGLRISSVFSDDLKYRYKLIAETSDIKDGDLAVCVIMQNPSYANDDIADKSINFLEQLIFQKKLKVFENVKRMVVVNQYAQILTEGFKPDENSNGGDNNASIEQTIIKSDIIVIAWGASNSFKDRKEFVHKLLRESTSKIILATKKHPSLGSLSEDFLVEYTEFNASISRPLTRRLIEAL
jgi:hypothetical protein